MGICPSEPLQHLVIIGWLPNTPFVGERCGGGPHGCPRFPTLPFHSALPNAPMSSARTLPAPVLHNAPGLLPGISYPALPCVPAHPIGPCLLPTLSYTALPCLPRCPPINNLLRLLPAISYPALACLPPVPHASSLSHRVAVAAQGLSSASRCSNSRSPATSCSAGQGHTSRAS